MEMLTDRKGSEFYITGPGFEPEDMSLMYNSWLLGVRDMELFSQVPNEILFRAQKDIVDELLDTKGVYAYVVRSPVDPIMVRAYAVGGNGALHWCFTKSNWKRRGYADALIAKIETHGKLATFTHPKEPFAGVLRRRGLEYDGRLFGGRRS